MKLLRIVGARPQFMQAAVLRKELDKRGHEEVLVHTGQHYDDKMSKIFFEQLGIPWPDINLAVGSATHGVQTGKMLAALDHVVVDVKPDVIVVDGDTNSTLAGALVGPKLHIPVVHVEAGLRSFDKRMPEEVNRIVADHLGDLLCAPTQTAMANLNDEGLGDKAILTGDLMYDCFLHYRDMANKEGVKKALSLPDDFVLATIHRPENTDDLKKMKAIVSALNSLEIPVLLPVHPRTKNIIEPLVDNMKGSGSLILMDPVSYLDMIALEENATSIITDSGGVQREACFAGCPSIVIRESTEWLEQVERGWTNLCSANTQAILRSVENLGRVSHMQAGDVYGDGKAAVKIVNGIERLIG